MIDLPEIRCALGAHRPRLAAPGSRLRAAVALLLRGREAPEVLFIERAHHERDPWSGHLGFPGGKVDAGDAGPRAAAERETLEEVGVDLGRAEIVGRLDDMASAQLPVVVSCFVYWIPFESRLAPNHEVARAFWFPLPGLLDPERHLEARFSVRGEHLLRPAVRLLDSGGPLLWGITYRLVRDFFEILGREVPAPAPSAGAGSGGPAPEPVRRSE